MLNQNKSLFLCVKQNFLLYSVRIFVAAALGRSYRPSSIIFMSVLKAFNYAVMIMAFVAKIDTKSFSRT